MTKYKQTSQGRIPFTPEEKLLRDQEEVAWESGADDRKATEVREKRTKLLAASDWMALTDNTLSNEWAVYRQALRDITDQVGFPYNVVFPTKPNQ